MDGQAYAGAGSKGELNYLPLVDLVAADGDATEMDLTGRVCGIQRVHPDEESRGVGESIDKYVRPGFTATALVS